MGWEITLHQRLTAGILSWPERYAPPQLSPTKPRGAPSLQILSLQNPATSQGGSLWRNPCVGGTLAANYRVGPDYNVDYSSQEPHTAGQSQAPHPYDAHHHRGSLQHGGPSSLHEPPPHQSHHGLPQHYTSTHHPHPILTDPSHLGGHPGAPRHMALPGPSHYGPGPSPHSAVPPLFPSLTPTHGSSSGVKRPRPDDLDLSVPGMAEMEQNDLESMQQTPLGAAYAQAAGMQPTHHHHRLPDTGPPNKVMRREGESSATGGAPSVVGQAGMPAPAPRPRGPKLKFTPEDDQLLIDLKENKSLTWKQIADFFPGRSSGTLQVRYCTKLKAKTTQWTDETDQKLKSALQDYENEKWRIIANKVGTGFTPAACRERAASLLGESLPPNL
ncbi:transcriptional activator Myb [Podospora fimiseda]|uniref:Transcriptional activator Myb n=1 Tax=Podospora fimiseda TaxID=252190 RepID=A0AAN7H8C3_9PEZI|nr:transcriptional activator Myb [Podospora fimiseda]